MLGVVGVVSVGAADEVGAGEVLPPPDPSPKPRTKRNVFLHRRKTLPTLIDRGQTHGLGAQRRRDMEHIFVDYWIDLVSDWCPCYAGDGRRRCF